MKSSSPGSSFLLSSSPDSVRPWPQPSRPQSGSSLVQASVQSYTYSLRFLLCARRYIDAESPSVRLTGSLETSQSLLLSAHPIVFSLPQSQHLCQSFSVPVPWMAGEMLLPCAHSLPTCLLSFSLDSDTLEPGQNSNKLLICTTNLALITDTCTCPSIFKKH